MENQKIFFDRGYKLIAGVDEVGRGPLAGPVCAAAVILPYDLIIDGVNDSKKLTEKKRERLYDEIIKNAVAYSVAYVEPSVIDEINIRQATHKAMQKAVNGLSVTPDLILVDGNDRIPFENTESEYVIKGDATYECIAAASIIAKVERDRYMIKMNEIYPNYGFAKNKGYGTAVHMQAIRDYGLTPLHRRSFITDKVLGKA